MNIPAEGMCFVITPGRIEESSRPTPETVDEREWTLVRTTTTKTPTTMTKSQVFKRRGFENTI